MSYVAEDIKRENGKRSVVKAENGKTYCVDTCETYDHGWETMIFRCDEKGHVSDWNDLYCKVYETEDQALSNHAYIAKNISVFVELWEE